MQAGNLAVARCHAVLFGHGHEGAEDQVFERDAKFTGVALQRRFQCGLRPENVCRCGLYFFVHRECCWHFLVPFIGWSHVVTNLSTVGRETLAGDESEVWSLQGRGRGRGGRNLDMAGMNLTPQYVNPFFAVRG